MTPNERTPLTMTRISITAIAAVSIVLAACGGGGTPTERVRIESTLTELAFAPKSWEVPAGKPVKIILHNKGVLEHDVTIDALKISVKALAGKDIERDFVAIPAGEYDVICSVAGHKESGMVGKLIVK